MNAGTFMAPWGKMLRWTSGVSLLLVFAVCALIIFTARPDEISLVGWLLPLIVMITALFTVRGYTIEPRELLIHRLLWMTRVPLAGLQPAEAVPDAMRGSFRLFGNGGMFSFTGLYRSRALGNYRAFVTDLNLTVVMRFEKRTIVISPDNPGQFVAEISQFVSRV